MNTVDSLFFVGKGHQLALNAAEQVESPSEGVAFVARSHRNHGITAWVREVPGLVPAKAGDLSVCLRSRNHALSTFVQPRDFYSTYHVAVLTPRSEMSIQEKLWWGLCIRANRFRYGFGRQANRTLGSLVLPSEVPGWVKTHKIPSHENAGQAHAEFNLKVAEWGEFLMSDIFEPVSGAHAVKRDLEAGSTPLVTASDWNNGISDYIDIPPDWAGGQITVPNNGSIGAAFYQPRPFSASRDVTVLNPKVPISAAAALFICAIIRKEGARYNYARKWTAGRMRQTVLRLPATNGNPDYGRMEELISALPLGWAVSP